MSKITKQFFTLKMACGKTDGWTEESSHLLSDSNDNLYSDFHTKYSSQDSSLSSQYRLFLFPFPQPESLQQHLQLKMKKYLLICLLIFVSLSKFRNLKNLTIAGTTSPQIKFLSENQLAYQSASTITTFNIQTGKPTQTINLQTTGTPAQLLPAHSVIIYVNKSSIYEARTLDNNRGYLIPKTKSTWIAPITSFGKTTIAMFYSTATSTISLQIYGPKTSDVQSIDFMGQPINGIRGGSSVSFLGDNEFYFVAGGQCNDTAKYTNLYRNSRDISKVIYKFAFDNCHFSGQNELWNLQSKSFNKISYHLLTLIPSDQQPFVHTSQLISNSSGEYASVAHFETQRLIGIELTQSNTIYTADNMLCRVLQHDIDNHQHEHYPSSFQSKPLSVQIFDDQNIVLATVKLPLNTFYSAVIYSINDQNNLVQADIFAGQNNYLKAELYLGNYVVVYDDSNKSSLSIFKWKPQGFVSTTIDSVFDISISQNFIYVAYSNGVLTILEAFQIGDDKLISLGQKNIITSVMSIKVLNGQNIILIPKNQGEDIQVYGFSRLTKFTVVSSLKRNNTIHASFAFAGEVLLFTSKSGDKTTFYNYLLKPLTLSFNLPSDSAHSIIDYRNGQLLLAVGDDINHFVSLEYYKISNMTVSYLGTFPYLDEGKIDSSKTFLYTTKRALHVEFESGVGQQWSTYFDLDNPPLKSFGYFYDADSYCSDYSKATFSITPNSKQILLLYNSVDSNSLERWAIEGSTLVKKQSVPLNNFKSTNLDIKIASQGGLVLVNGISSLDDARNYAVQVRNMKSLSQVLSYQVISNSSSSQSFESADIANNMFVSSYSFANLGQIDFGISFKSVTQSPLPINNQLFTSITIIATCQSCNWIAFTGQLATPQPNSQIIIQDYTNPSSYQQISANCKINLLAISPAGNSLSWNCQNNSLFVYEISTKTTSNVKLQVYQKASDLLMISETRIIVSLDGKITNIDLTVKNGPTVGSAEPNAFSSIYATNLQKQIYAVAIDASTIQLITFTNETIDTVKINNSIPISSMSFNANGDLYISNNQGFIVVLTEAACPKDQELLNNNCQCKPLFNPTQGSTGCICPFSYDSAGENCNCDDGQYYDGATLCLDCSFLCTACNDGGGFDCDEFSAWFYVFIILLVLIIAGAGLFIALKLKKKKRLPSLMTEEKQTPTEPFVSERENYRSEQGTKERI